MTAADGPAIPIAAHPDPVVEYAVRDGRVTLGASNDAFADASRELSEEATVAGLFDQFDVVESTGADTPVEQVRRGDDVDVYLDGVGGSGTADDADGTGVPGPYLARIVATDEETGYLVLADLDDALDLAGTVRFEAVARGISHDLRNPLDVAGARLRAARETGADEHFDAVAAAHDRMERIVGDVLTLARGERDVDPSTAVPIGDAARDAWRAVDTGEAELVVEGPLPETAADPDLLGRLLENLFRNAVEHGSTSPPSQAREDAGEHAADPPTVTVAPLDDREGFAVADDGSGIPPDEREAVFDAGYTVDGDGTGLGLAIVDRIVAAHGWDCSIERAADGGARFELRF